MPHTAQLYRAAGTTVCVCVCVETQQITHLYNDMQRDGKSSSKGERLGQKGKKRGKGKREGEGKKEGVRRERESCKVK